MILTPTVEAVDQCRPNAPIIQLVTETEEVSIIRICLNGQVPTNHHHSVEIGEGKSRYFLDEAEWREYRDSKRVIDCLGSQKPPLYYKAVDLSRGWYRVFLDREAWEGYMGWK